MEVYGGLIRMDLTMVPKGIHQATRSGVDRNWIDNTGREVESGGGRRRHQTPG